MAKRAAQGAGSIRRKTITRSGKQYIYWEARYTVGRDPGTGKQIQRTVTGKTQQAVRQKLAQITAAIDAGTYQAPSKMTVGQWLEIWQREYLGSVKPRTVELYRSNSELYLMPAFGAVALTALNTPTIQALYNRLGTPQNGKPALTAKTIKNIHGVLHRALQQAVAIGYLRFNPADACTLPRIVRKEIQPLDEQASAAFLQAIQGHPFETLFRVDLFTGLRQGELLGLTWDCVDFEHGTILVNKQLQFMSGKGYFFSTLKNDKPRTITPAPSVMEALRRRQIQQTKERLLAGPLWENSGLVFTTPTGGHLKHETVYKQFKQIVAGIGHPEARFHDLRHSYAVAAIRSGDDIKTVQGNLGHHTAAFTLDVYGHVTEQMKQDSAARMESYINRISNL